MCVRWGFTHSFDNNSVRPFLVVLGCALTYAHSSVLRKDQVKAFVQWFFPPSHHYQPCPIHDKLVPWFSLLLSSLVLIGKSWWGAASHSASQTISFQQQKACLHSLIIDDEQVSKMTHCKGGAFFPWDLHWNKELKAWKIWSETFFGGKGEGAGRKIRTTLGDMRSLIFWMVKS